MCSPIQGAQMQFLSIFLYFKNRGWPLSPSLLPSIVHARFWDNLHLWKVLCFSLFCAYYLDFSLVASSPGITYIANTQLPSKINTPLQTDLCKVTRNSFRHF